jgi:mono/diheme cytochrome c family protein
MTNTEENDCMNMRSVRWVISFTLALSAGAAFGGVSDLELKLPGEPQARKLTLEEMEAKLEAVTVTVDDPVYKKKKTYHGFALLDVLTLAGLKDDGQGDEIVFTAKDGYSPHASFEMLREHRAFLTFREQGKSGFEEVAQGKARVSPDPYYLVWEEGSQLAESVPWPYQLVKIELVNFHDKYNRMHPDGVHKSSSVRKGFLVFKNHCVRCHSINLQGGDLGPELNAPQNVTEYWAKDTLKRFIRDASSFRYKDKMPPFLHLKDQELEEVLDYLEFMKGHKLPPSEVQ